MQALWKRLASLLVTDNLTFGKHASLIYENRMVPAGSALSVDRWKHNERIIALDTAAGSTCTLPPATGSGARFRFMVTVVPTSNQHKIQVSNATDVIQGGIVFSSDNASDALVGFETAGTSDTISLNGTTTGGVSIGDYVELVDLKAGFYGVNGRVTGSGTEATPFSAAVS